MKKNQQYVWTEALCDGWGCVGVWPKNLVDSAKKASDGRPLLKEEDMIVGQGGGWDSPGTFDSKWMTLACEAINHLQKKTNKI